jgi:hypothetical protein
MPRKITPEHPGWSAIGEQALFGKGFYSSLLAGVAQVNPNHCGGASRREDGQSRGKAAVLRSTTLRSRDHAGGTTTCEQANLAAKYAPLIPE